MATDVAGLRPATNKFKWASFGLFFKKATDVGGLRPLLIYFKRAFF